MSSASARSPSRWRSSRSSRSSVGGPAPPIPTGCAPAEGLGPPRRAAHGRRVDTSARLTRTVWHPAPMLHIGVVALAVADVERAATFWCRALGYEPRRDGFGGWPVVLVPPT